VNKHNVHFQNVKPPIDHLLATVLVQNIFVCYIIDIPVSYAPVTVINFFVS